jgi:predicted nucleic acid-binding protein
MAVNAWYFPGLCEAILTESAQRNSLLTTQLVQREAHEVLTRKFPHMPHAKALFDAVWAEANCVSDVDEPKNDNDERLVRVAPVAQADIFVTGDRRILDWGDF